MRKMLLAAALAASLAFPLASGIAAGKGSNAVSPKLVGKWTRTVTLADVKRSGAYGVQPGSTWTLVVKKSGAAAVGTPSAPPPFTGKIVPAGAGRVHINLGTPVTNVYSWHVSGRLLTFTKLKDSEPDRVAAFWGVWKRH